jgi:hypothetical protein
VRQCARPVCVCQAAISEPETALRLEGGERDARAALRRPDAEGIG